MPRRKPFWYRYHPARLLYLFLLGFPVGLLASELQTFFTAGPNALYDGDWDFAHLTNTWIVRFAVAQPLMFFVALASALAFAYLGYRLDHRYQRPTGKLPLIRARDLDRTTLRMGDDAAATRPYAESIVHDAFAQATATLHAAAARRSPKRGILVLGESNAGKTRLALEALIATLPRWPVLMWSPIYTADVAPPAESLHGRKLVIFVDDLPDYVSTPTPVPGSSATSSLTKAIALADPASTLRTLVAEVRTAAGKRGRVLLVITCRAPEGLERARTGLAAFFDELDQVIVPSFADSDIDRVAAALRQAAAGCADVAAAPVREADWDGTLGSLVLGLSTKQQEYEQLRSAASPAVPVLHAMKLLARSSILAHTEPRLRAVCASIFGQLALRDDLAVWQAALADLTRLQFVTVAIDHDTGDTMLVIRKDPAYFDRVITAYPNPAQTHQFEQERDALLSVFAASGDAVALFYLGNAYCDLQRYNEALAAYDSATHIRPTFTTAWFNKAIALEELGRSEEALTSYDTALEGEPNDPMIWLNKSSALEVMGRYKEALIAVDNAIGLAPDDANAWNNKGNILSGLHRYGDALQAYDRGLAFANVAKTKANLLLNKGVTLNAIGKRTEALAAYDAAIEIAPMDPAPWINRGNALTAIGSFAEALAAYDEALARAPSEASAYHNKGNTLVTAGRLIEALAAYAETIARDPKWAAAHYNKGVVLDRLGRFAEALAAYEATVSLDPDFADAHHNRGVDLASLGRYEEAIDAFDAALALNHLDADSQQGKARVLRILDRHGDTTYYTDRNTAASRAHQIKGH